MKTVRWGILSTASIGRRSVVPAIVASRNGTVAVVASRDPNAAADFVAGLNLNAETCSYEELLDPQRVDAIYNPLPNSMHVEWSRRALEAGIPVLCEKPVGLDAADGESLLRTAEKTGVTCMEAFMYRFHPRIVTVIGLCRDGALGDVRAVHGAFTFVLDRPGNIRWLPEFGGGSLMDVGCYVVNIARTVIGEEPVAARATALWADTGVDAQLDGMLRFGDGQIAHVTSGLNMQRNEFVQIVGTKGRIALETTFVPRHDPTEIAIHRGPGNVERITFEGRDEYQEMVEHFADCVMDGTPPRYPLTDAVANQRAADALYESARQDGKEVPV